MDNELKIASAGSGKTQLLIDKAVSISKNKNVLITTFTTTNKISLYDRIIKQEYGVIPDNIQIQGWYSFLLEHGVKPYLATYNKNMIYSNVKGTTGFNIIKPPLIYCEKNWKYYFTNDGRIYTERIAKFVVKNNEKSSGKILNRLEKIFQYIFIDEIQDLCGYDLELLKLFCNSNIKIFAVGDLRQSVYLTHNEQQNKKYKYKIDQFVIKKIGNDNCKISTLSKSHRIHQSICDFASSLYPNLPKMISCDCCEHKKDGIEKYGVFLIRSKDVKEYLNKYSALQLRYDKNVLIQEEKYKVFNFGESKGLEFDCVLIYPTKNIENFIKTNKINKISPVTLSKFYVAITRAKYTVAIVYDYKDDEVFENKLFKKYKE